MKAMSFIVCLLIGCRVWSQNVEIIVPKGEVVLGTAFQVQYVITDPSDLTGATEPVFDNCTVISGPNIYKGIAEVNGKLQPIQNIAYTLVPTRVGVLKISGIIARYKNDQEIKSADAGITVIPQPRASFTTKSSYTDATLYMPSSKKDLNRLIEENLFIRTIVNKRVCYEGEPVTATFKLYSRLQSSSEAEKSPAFYGFSVVDMLNIRESHTAVETVNGQIFNTSILRQVQLYPVQSGTLTVDQMFVQNEIEFEDSLTHYKTKVEKEIITEPISITVKPLPAKKPENFTGAVGDFEVRSYLEKENLKEETGGKLIISIKGKGNFIQFGQPVISWPKGIEPFEPVIEDQLNKDVAPITGERKYIFGFAADSAGNYNIEPIAFSYFDISDGSFKNRSTDSLELRVTTVAKRYGMDVIRQKAKNPYLLVSFLVIAVVLTLIFVYGFRKKKSKEQSHIVPPSPETYRERLSRINWAVLSEKDACIEIQKLLRQCYTEHSAIITPAQEKEFQNLLKACQQLVYSHANEETLLISIRQKAKKLFMEFETV